MSPKAEALSQTDVIDLPLLALIIFLVVFAIVVVRAWRAGKDNPKHEYLASLPLFDDEVPTTSSSDQPQPNTSHQQPRGGVSHG